ncbi:putative Cytosolic phospholipase A2 [Cocos nucifera]|uniref:Putative Cytosolic phospholipase A2 n=1 Tax=Cocos nucifera TaxID=13894 RepID=A0A8K0MYS2_COCNU|nr:putative Cytosolic phospholipase A2 [Cocos nucifera]
MARKRNPILGRAWDLIILSISPIAKVKKPVSRKLLFFKRSKRFKLHKHYNYAFVGEYEFSPSSTPLILHPRTPSKKKNHFLCLPCGGNDTESIVEESIGDEWEMLSPCADESMQKPSELSEPGEEDDSSSIDQKAEKFIERFYQEMRIQRQESIMHHMEMLHKSS